MIINTMTFKTNEKLVEEFAKKITSCTHVGGFHTCVMDDPKDNESYKKVATLWLRSALAAKDSQLEEAIHKLGTVFGYELVVTDKLGDEVEIRGYKRGMEDAKRQLRQALGLTQKDNN